MRAWLGWIAAVLLIALAFTGGPEAIDTARPAAQSAVSAGENTDKRDPQVRDDAGIDRRLADRGVPGRPRLLTLPPSSQTTSPTPVKAASLPAPGAAPATIVTAGTRPHLAARTPAALQIFRC